MNLSHFKATETKEELSEDWISEAEHSRDVSHESAAMITKLAHYSLLPKERSKKCQENQENLLLQTM